MRHPYEYALRSGIAWLVSLVAVFFLLFVVTLSFVVGFGEQDAQDLLKSWAISLVMVIFTVEPINTALLAALPVLTRGDSPIMRTYQRIYTAYSEIFS